MRYSRVLTLAACLVFASMTRTQLGGQPPVQSAPNVSGQWTGIWWDHPPTPAAPKLNDKPCSRMDCSVVRKDAIWQATFEGECGQPYKFTITMDGRQAGEVVLFKGTTDLGEKNGGIFDWIGRATDNCFVGFFTSATHVGEFRLDRKK